MTMLADTTDIELIIACQKAYLILDEHVCSSLNCTLEDDTDIVDSKSSLKGVVENYFKDERHRDFIESELAYVYNRKLIYHNSITESDNSHIQEINNIKVLYQVTNTLISYRAL